VIYRYSSQRPALLKRLTANRAGIKASEYAAVVVAASPVAIVDLNAANESMGALLGTAGNAML
jgi:hypothetical protein